jgi:hypothetical protein
MKKDYTAEVVNIWKGTVDSCDCIEGVNLRINIDEQSLIQRDGLTWVHHDNIYAVSPEELACNCSCTGTKPVYANNVMTKLLAQKVNAANSPFYEAAIEDEDGVVITDVDAFIAANLVVNTDDDDTNDGKKLVLVIKGKKSPALQYRFFEINEVYPRGVRLHPGMVVNGQKNIAFTETQKLAYEIGAGYDLMSEEWDNMSNYTTLNHYTKYSDGLPNPNVNIPPFLRNEYSKYDLQDSKSNGWLIYKEVKLFPKKDKWESEEWKTLNKPENAPAADLLAQQEENNQIRAIKSIFTSFTTLAIAAPLYLYHWRQTKKSAYLPD